MTVERQISIPAAEISIADGHPIGRLQWIGAIVGVIGLVASALFGLGNPGQFYHSYLVAYLFFVTLALGGLIFVLIQFVTRAGWSVTVRRQAEHLAGTVPLFVLLFVPIILGMHDLYPWADPEHTHGDPILQMKGAYLNTSFFLLRALVYLAAWSVIALWFRRQSIRQDEIGGTAITRRLQNVSAPAIVVFAVTLTFASFDWIMSLDPHWYSTVFGVYVFGGAFMSAIAFLILSVLTVQRYGLLRRVVTIEHLHDLGKLLFAFVVFWAYIAFSQFMLIWYANIPEETIWFAHRWEHGWQYLSVLLAAGHFVLPFFLIISRGAKRNRRLMTLAVLWLLAMHYLDMYWLVMPSFQSEGLAPSIVDLLTFAGVGGLFLAAYCKLAMKPMLVPRKDPRLAESLSFETM